uniref:Putative glucose transport protein n=1 Tax=Schistosoma mansoni TaxID=6183 RepID=A0A5K4EDL0_SCHMA
MIQHNISLATVALVTQFIIHIDRNIYIHMHQINHYSYRVLSLLLLLPLLILLYTTTFLSYLHISILSIYTYMHKIIKCFNIVLFCFISHINYVSICEYSFILNFSLISLIHCNILLLSSSSSSIQLLFSTQGLSYYLKPLHHIYFNCIH